MIKVYSYRVWSLTDDTPLEDQLRLASSYRKRLVEIELEKRRRVAEAEELHIDGLSAARARLRSAESILSELTDAPADERPDRAHVALARQVTKESLCAVALLEKEIKKFTARSAKMFRLRKRWRLLSLGRSGPWAKRQVNQELLETLIAEGSCDPLWIACRQADHDATEAVREARATNGLTAGTSGLVDEEIESAKRDPGEFGRHRQPRRVGVQLLPPLSAAELHTGKRPALKIGIPVRSNRRKALAPFTIRLGAKPVTVEVSGTCNVYRPLPEDAKIVSAALVRSKLKGRVRWDLQLTIKTEIGVSTQTGTGVCAVDVSWRERGDDVVVGTVVDTVGTVREVVIPGILRLERFQGNWRSGLDSVIPMGLPVLISAASDSDAEIGRWVDGEHMMVPVRELVDDSTRRPELLCSIVTAIVGHERQNAFLSTTWQQWKAERLPKKLDLFCGLLEFSKWLGVSPKDGATCWLLLWREKVRHMDRVRASIDAANARRRKEHCRAIVTRLRAEYDQVVVDGKNLAFIATRSRGQKANAVRHKSAPGMFRLSLKQKFGTGYSALAVKDAPTDPVEAAKHLLELHASGDAQKKGKSKRKQRKRSRGITISAPLANRGARV